MDAHFHLGKLLLAGLQNDKNGILIKKPEYDLAIIHFKQTIKIKKDFVEPYYYLGIIYRITNQHDESLKYLKKALKIDDNYSKAHFEIAMLYKDIIDRKN